MFCLALHPCGHFQCWRGIDDLIVCLFVFYCIWLGLHVDNTNAPVPGGHKLDIGGKQVHVCGAVEMQCGIGNTVKGESCSSFFVVFSEEITTLLIKRDFLDPRVTPKDQVGRSKNGKELKGDLVSLCKKVGEICKNGPLEYPADYQVFAVPTAAAAAYIIRPGCCHAFFRHSSFRGAVLRLWWETTSLRC